MPAFRERTPDDSANRGESQRQRQLRLSDIIKYFLA
jgi:hypothetical protein